VVSMRDGMLVDESDLEVGVGRLPASGGQR
jgi:hypothetical protein